MQKAPCANNFRAIEQAMHFSKACDITGIVVDLFHGEQQKNVDWSFLECIRMTNVDSEQGIMLIYDIICQYFIYLYSWIRHLLPDRLEIDQAIGLFHVHGNKEECFYRFAPCFIPGTGIVAGEACEPLWAKLNPITTATRTATLAHRAEVLDDHASDLNHKKGLGIGNLDS